MQLSNDQAPGFKCRKTDDGYTWSYASAFGELLAVVEARYGPRDTSYTPLGVEISDLDRPQIWFPGNRKYVAIQLSRQAAEDWTQGLFQLAHETIHILAPEPSFAPRIEEGLATLFADQFARSRGFSLRTFADEYLSAKADLMELLSVDQHAIRNLREHSPSFRAWTAEFVLSHYPALDPNLADRLCTRVPF
jgi:hypothetical protein